MAQNYAYSKETRYPLQAKAFKIANELINDKRGFVFEVETVSGKVYCGPTPSAEPIEIDNEGILSIEDDETTVFIDNKAIAAIRVIPA